MTREDATTLARLQAVWGDRYRALEQDGQYIAYRLGAAHADRPPIVAPTAEALYRRVVDDAQQWARESRRGAR